MTLTISFPRRLRVAALLVLAASSTAAAQERRAILLTGYWPPSNEMVRRFSIDPEKNPDGWQGENWEGRGYDVYSIFPEFGPRDCVNCFRGFGQLRVDYQDTTADFWPYANAIQPVAIMTLSRGFENRLWEIEMNAYNRIQWYDDYANPRQPTPAPPDASVPAGYLRRSTLPVNEIATAIDESGLGLDGFVCETQDGGGFLSEFIGYLGTWYQSIHADPADPAHCVAAGHVHVGSNMTWAEAEVSLHVALGELIATVDERYPGPAIAVGGRGTVDAGCGPAVAVLFANGSSGGLERTVDLPLGAPLALTIREAPSMVLDRRPSRLAVYGWIAEPIATDIVDVPGGYGRMCFGFSTFATLAPRRAWVSIGRPGLLGPHDASGDPPTIPNAAELVLTSVPGGFRRPVRLTFQGLIEDRCGPGQYPFSVTNGVLVRVGG